MTNARWFSAAVLLALTLSGATLATAQVVVQVEDLIGTWELVSTKDLKTGAAVYGIEDASTMVAQVAAPPINPTTTREVTYRRIE